MYDLKLHKVLERALLDPVVFEKRAYGVVNEPDAARPGSLHNRYRCFGESPVFPFCFASGITKFPSHLFIFTYRTISIIRTSVKKSKNRG